MKKYDGTFLVRSLQKQIKQSGMTYSVLAKKMEMSEAGIKKIFAKSDISLARALQICDLLGVELTELIQDSVAEMSVVTKLNEKQQQFFLNHPHYFHFFMQLSYEQKSVEGIQKQYQLSDRTVFKYLKKLDDLGLIELGAKNKIHFIKGQVYRIQTTGTNLEKIKFQSSHRFLNNLENKKHGFLGAGIFDLTESEIENMKSDIMHVHDTYLKKAQLNRARRKRNDQRIASQTYSFMFAYGPETLFNDIQPLD